MSIKIDDIVEAADGTIDKDLLTQTGEGGILSNGYLHTKPLLEYLEVDETLAYLFDNLKKGIEAHKDGDQQTVTPDSSYRTIAAITSKRVLFVIGQADGDEVIEVPLSEIVTATAHSGFRTDQLEIETVEGTIDFYLRSDSETVDAADYINQQLSALAAAQETARSTETETQSASKAAESDTRNPDSTTANEESDVPTEQQRAGKNADTTSSLDNSPTTDMSQSSQADGEPFPVPYIDQTTVSDDSLNLVREAETLVQNVGTEIEDIEDAREQLTRAHNKLCRVVSADDPGVNEDEIDQRVADIETRLDALQKAAQIISNAQEIDADTGDNITRKSRLYRRAINAVEDVGLSLPEVEAALAESQSDHPAPEIDSERGAEPTDTEPTDTTAPGKSEPADNTTGEQDTKPKSRRQGEMIAEIESVADELDRIPRYSDMHDRGTFKAQEYSQAFGSWDQALQATTIDIEQQLIDALKAVGDKLGRAPTKSEVDEFGKYESDRYCKYFDDFDAALAAAGLEKPDETALLNELHRLQDELGFPPTSHHVEHHSEYPVTFYRKAFGSVRKAAEQAGIDYEAAVIDAIRAIAVSLERRPKSKEFDEYAQYSSSYVYNYFDGWQDACDAAGVGSDATVSEFIAQRSASEIMELYNRAAVTDELPQPDVGEADTAPTKTADDSTEKEEPASSRDELLDKLEAVTADLGRVPSYTDMYEYDGVDPVEYTEVFGSWKQALDESAIDIESRLLRALEELEKELKRVPTKSEIDKHGRYDARWYEDYFDSLDDALSQVGFEHPSRDDLIDELQHLQEELGYVPAKRHVEEYGNYSSKLYRKEFGSVKQATIEAGFEYEEDVLEALRDVAREIGKRPTTNDFAEHGRYSSSYVYDHFDTWGHACNAAGVVSDAAVEALIDESTKTDATEGERSAPSDADSTTDIEPSPLAEYYEVFGTLIDVQSALLGDNIPDHIGQTAPMARWHTLVHNRWAGEAPSSSTVTESYGAQQNERTDFAITDYRETYGNGDLITEFQAIETAPLPASVIELLSMVADLDDAEAAEIRLPKAPDSDRPLPVFVESEAEYERAKALLEEFPERPPTTVESEGGDQEPQKASGPEGPKEDDPAEPKAESDGDLTEIGGITPSIATALRNAGYESKDDLREADIEDLMEVEGIESQKANRIKLLVGG